MDCRTCEPTLIDLVHDELATDAAADARAHLAECASCRSSFERLVAARRLTAGLEVEKAPQAVSARLIQLAESRAAELRAQAAPKPPPSLARRLLDFVAGFAMGPQVGMATIMLLIVAVGLWSLPRMRREPIAGSTVVDAERDGEAVPSPGVEPANRLDLEVDPRSRRIRSSDGQKEGAQGVLPSAPLSPAGAPVEVAEAAPAAASDDRGRGDPLARLDDVDDLFEAKKEAPSDESRQLEQRAEADEPLDDALGGLGAAPTKGAPEAESSADLRRSSADTPQAFPASPEAIPAQELADARAAVPQAAAQPATQLRQKAKRVQAQPSTTSTRPSGQASAAPASAPAPAPARAPQRDLPQNAFRSSEGAGAATQSSSSLIEAARSLSRTRGCAAALSTYDRAVAASPESADAGTALIEMAQCKRSLGLPADALRLLERAAAIPATRDRARALIQAQ